MINKKDIIEFFDHCAEHWDRDMVRNDEVIAEILCNAGVSAGSKVLDVACGTGVLIPDYIKLDVASVTGIDISPEMIERASEKFRSENINFICADVEAAELPGDFTNIVVYNAFPHFPDPAGLIKRLSELLVPGGKLTIAHGMSRAKIDSIHHEGAQQVSMGLMHEDDLEKLFAPYLKVTVKISDDKMYQVVGEKL